jgi:hypothetical protein
MVTCLPLQITCVTPAVETDNSFTVQVEAGGLVAQHCCFAYAEWASPGGDANAATANSDTLCVWMECGVAWFGGV